MKSWHGLTVTVAAACLVLVACAGDDAAPTANSSPTTASPGNHPTDHQMDPHERAAAMLATARFQDVAVAEAAGYGSSLDTLGCFQDPQRGGMGVHYVNQVLMDGEVDIGRPEALVYELDAGGHIVGLVAHEYIVPTDAWTASEPPSLFRVPFHRHPTLPLWVLHTWLWKANPGGVFEDWNAAVRPCPVGTPIFGMDPYVSADAAEHRSAAASS
jgi:hypothetical protein